MNFLNPGSSSFLPCVLLLCLFTTVHSVVHAGSSTEIRRVSFASRSDGEGVVVRLHAVSPVNAFSEPRMEAPDQFELIVFNAALSDSYKPDTPSDPILDLSVESRKGHLVFTFGLDNNVIVKTSAYPDEHSNDILIGITLLEDNRIKDAGIVPIADRGTELPEVRSSESSTKSARKNSNNKKESVIPVQQASHSSLSGDRWVLDTVVIDAGHGGHDSGAVSNGVKEKDVNLAVALKLGYYLERFLDLNVVYTRTDDRFIELQERGHIANEAGAKLFISIHANSAPYSRQVRGTETYILGLHRSDKAREVMERENSVVALEENPDQYNDFTQGSILRTLALSANLRMSEKLAGYIENQFAERARRNSRGVKQAGLIVLWAASMPAVLVELGYLTNRFEAAYLNSQQGQDYLASAIFRAVRDFKQDYEKGLELSASSNE